MRIVTYGNFSPTHSSAQRDAGHLSAWWLGGAGFIFKAASGREVWIDPYLSDAAYDLFGLKRAFAAPIAVGRRIPISSSLPTGMKIISIWFNSGAGQGSPKREIPHAAERHGAYAELGVSRAQIIPLSHGQTVSLGDTAVTSVPARHVVEIAGWEVPDAMASSWRWTASASITREIPNTTTGCGGSRTSRSPLPLFASTAQAAI